MSFSERQHGVLASTSRSGNTAPKASRPLAPPSPSPSIASAKSAVINTPTKNGAANPKKRPFELAAGAIYSQPALSGVAKEVQTKVLLAVDALKTKDRELTFSEVLDQIAGQHSSEAEKRELSERMRVNPRIRFIPDPKAAAAGIELEWRTGKYVHHAVIPNVRTKDALLKLLQKRKDAKGLMVKELEDGWKNCGEGITELEAEHKVLVTRTKKDNLPRYVWLDDTSLWHDEIDPEFQSLWGRVELPRPDDMYGKMRALGMKPTGDDPRLLQVNAPKAVKKKRKTNRPTKITNDHLLGNWA